MLRDGNVHKGIKGISNMEDEIYNIVNNLISGKDVNDIHLHLLLYRGGIIC